MTATALERDPADGQRARLEAAFVWLVWGLALAWLAVRTWSFARPVPLAEDWLLVEMLTGQRSDLAGFLWEQNNEHRVPLPRLVLLALLRASGGDFRAGGFFNLALLGALSAACILAVRRLRGGRTSWSDAFFPALWLHFGHSANLLMGWQVVFALPAALQTALLLALASRQGLDGRRAALVAAACTAVLPLCGANGLLLVPVAAPIAALHAARWRRGRGETPRDPRVALALAAGAAFALAVSVLYFVGYQHPWWNPPNPGPWASLATATKVLGLGLGPAASRSWDFFRLAAIAAVAGAAVLGAHHVRRARGAERLRAVELLALFAALGALVAGVGWSRSAYVPEFGLPTRYALLVAPLLCAVWLVLARCDGLAGRRGRQGLAALALALLPFNDAAGISDFGAWYRGGMAALERDLRAGTPVDALAARHQPFLIHWWNPGELARHLRMLRDAGVGAFAGLPPDAPLPAEERAPPTKVD